MTNKFFRYFCIIISFFYSSYLFAAIPSKERSALISFYHATEGDKWTNKSGWLGIVGSECSWFGVTCLGGGNVTSLSLPYNNLKGPIPRELKQLSHLKRINLTNNQLRQAIPTELGQLSLLTSLQLSSNQLSGSIPADLGNLTKLGLLSISKNLLSGKIPNELGKLNKLRALFLNSNQLSGSIPAETNTLNAIGLIDLSDNKLSGLIPPSLAELNELRILKLHQNRLRDSMTAILENSNKISQLTLYDNCFDTTSIGFLSSPNRIDKLDIGNQNNCPDGQSPNFPMMISSQAHSIKIPLINVAGQHYKVILDRHIINPENPGWFWHASQITLINGVNQQASPSVEFNPQTTDLTFNQIYFRNHKIKATLQRYINPLDMNGFYYQYK